MAPPIEGRSLPTCSAMRGPRSPTSDPFSLRRRAIRRCAPRSPRPAPSSTPSPSRLIFCAGRIASLPGSPCVQTANFRGSPCVQTANFGVRG